MLYFKSSKLSKSELLIFLSSLCFYGLAAFWMTYNTQLALHPKYIHDLYLGFDNAFQNTSAVRHPLLKTFCIFLQKITVFVSKPEYLLNVICCFSLALQNLFIFKYLTKITKLTLYQSVLIILFYSGFSSNFILSFTFESYVFSTMLLPIFFYFNALYQSKKNISIVYLFSFLIGGITITNGLKVLVVSFYKKPKILLRNLFILSILAEFIFLIFRDFIQNSILHSMQFLKSGTSYLSDIYYLFLGGSVVFPKLEIENLIYENSDSISIITGKYPDFLSLKTLIIANVLFLLILAVKKNFKNAFLQVLLISFSIDVIIHCVFRLGLNEAHIFGGNFIFIYPLILGYLLKNSTNKILTINIIILTFLIYFVNLKDWLFILEFGKTFYPK